MLRSYWIFTLCLFLGFNSFSLACLGVELDHKKSSQHTEIIIPLPDKTVEYGNSIDIMNSNTRVNHSYKILAYWPSGHLRVLYFKLYQPIDGSLSLIVGNTKVADFQVSFIRQPQSPLIVNQKSLKEAILIHPHVDGVVDDWYTLPQAKYANYVTNQKLLDKKGYPKKRKSQWLYDRPQALYQLYIMSGDTNWLEKANEQAAYYITQIDKNGHFKLSAKYDPKYSMPRGLLYNYLLTGNHEAKNALARIYKASLKWDPVYYYDRGFWTERNQAAALNTAVSYWELFNDSESLTRIDEIIDATVKMTFEPVNNWPLRGCPQHTYRSHEGNNDGSATCSPWMMALLSDALWRFYQLTGDKRAEALLDTFGDFVLNHGLFWGNEKVDNIVIPKYIVAIDNPRLEVLNQWSDPQHMCDVAAMIGKSAYVKMKRRKTDYLVTELFKVLTQQCAANYKKLNKQNKLEYWLVQPARRFAWTYSTTSDLPWLYKITLGKNVFD